MNRVAEELCPSNVGIDAIASLKAKFDMSRAPGGPARNIATRVGRRVAKRCRYSVAMSMVATRGFLLTRDANFLL